MYNLKIKSKISNHSNPPCKAKYKNAPNDIPNCVYSYSVYINTPVSSKLFITDIENRQNNILNT